MKAWMERWGPVLLLMMLIFWLSSLPGSELPVLGKWDVWAKKAGHMLGYALLTIAFLRAMLRNGGSNTLRSTVSVCLVILYAISDEWHQSFVPGRTASPWDVVIDTAGSILGLAAWHWLHTKEPPFQNSHTRDRAEKEHIR